MGVLTKVHLMVALGGRDRKRHCMKTINDNDGMIAPTDTLRRAAFSVLHNR
jgi:hypothetical protein